MDKTFQNSQLLTVKVKLKNNVTTTLRPLLSTDAKALADFLSGLSITTRKFYTLDSFDEKTAQQLCADINKYDKLRFVADMNNEIVGLFEFSMDLVKEDIDRYAGYGTTLQSGRDCRFGPCIADSIQGTGFASAVFPYISAIAKKLGQKRMILWGGVFVENTKAIQYYLRNGFKEVGRFKNRDGIVSIDMIIEL